jgi:hypothetical protein
MHVDLESRGLLATDTPDRVWMAVDACPDCDVESVPVDDDESSDDDDFHGCDDCNDLDDADDVIQDIADAAEDVAEILAESHELVDGKSTLPHLRTVAAQLKESPSVDQLISARRAAIARR